jgi:hypothetical protein
MRSLLYSGDQEVNNCLVAENALLSGGPTVIPPPDIALSLKLSGVLSPRAVLQMPLPPKAGNITGPYRRKCPAWSGIGPLS